MLFSKITSFSYFWLTMFKLLRKIKLEHMLSFNCVIGASFKPLKSWDVWIDVLMLPWILCREALDCCGRGVRISVFKHKCQNMLTEWSTLVKKSVIPYSLGDVSRITVGRCVENQNSCKYHLLSWSFRSPHVDLYGEITYCTSSNNLIVSTSSDTCNSPKSSLITKTSPAEWDCHRGVSDRTQLYRKFGINDRFHPNSICTYIQPIYTQFECVRKLQSMSDALLIKAGNQC